MAEAELADARLGRRIIAETRLHRYELRVERAIKKALAIHQERAEKELRSLTAAIIPPDTFGIDTWDSTVDTEVLPVIREVLEDQASHVFNFLALPEEVRNQLLGQIDVAAEAEAFAAKVSGIGQPTANRLMEELHAGVNKGESIDKLTKRVTENFDIAQNKGKRIARTETHGAAERTTFSSAGAVHDAGIYVEKEWIATRDARTRKSHLRADGQTVAYDLPFTVGAGSGDHPGAMGSAKENINCRCSVVYSTPEKPEKQAPTNEAVTLTDLAKGKLNHSGLSGDALGHLKPKGSWTKAGAEKVRKAVRAEPGGTELMDVLENFQSGSTGATRANIETYLKGGKLKTKKAEKQAQALLDAIENSPEEWVPDKLYRGMTVRGTPEQIMEALPEGNVLEWNVSGFSSSRQISSGFAKASKQSGHVELMFEWDGALKPPGPGERPDKPGGYFSSRKALPIQNMSLIDSYHKEKEWLAGGRFYINEVKSSGNRVILKISQIRSLGH